MDKYTTCDITVDLLSCLTVDLLIELWCQSINSSTTQQNLNSQ